jgi:hypothetical protein
MSDADQAEVPEGAAVFPAIPAELGVDPLLLASIHAIVFLGGSKESVVHPDAAEEALQSLQGYLQRLHGERLQRIREDMACLTAFARQQKWPRQLSRFLQTFLEDYGIGTEEGTE